jgi:multiple antibiotic resistance protein
MTTGRPRLVAAAAAGAALLLAASAAYGAPITVGKSSGATIGFNLWQIFMGLFATLGPTNVLEPFARMTRGRDAAFRRRLAIHGAGIAAVALVFAAAFGAKVLNNWGVSSEALLLTAGIILFLVALHLVWHEYALREAPFEQKEPAPAPANLPPSIAFMPLAFPIIVTPYGIAVLVMLEMERASDVTMAQFLGVAAVVLGLDLLAMLFAERIVKTAVVAAALAIVGAVVGVLQISLGVQAMADGLRLLLVRAG